MQLHIVVWISKTGSTPIIYYMIKIIYIYIYIYIYIAQIVYFSLMNFSIEYTTLYKYIIIIINNEIV